MRVRRVGTERSRSDGHSEVMFQGRVVFGDLHECRANAISHVRPHQDATIGVGQAAAV